MDAKTKRPFDDVVNQFRVFFPGPFKGAVGDAGDPGGREVGGLLEMSVDFVHGDVNKGVEFMVWDRRVKGGGVDYGRGWEKGFPKKVIFLGVSGSSFPRDQGCDRRNGVTPEALVPAVEGPDLVRLHFGSKVVRPVPLSLCNGPPEFVTGFYKLSENGKLVSDRGGVTSVLTEAFTALAVSFDRFDHLSRKPWGGFRVGRFGFRH